MWNQIQSEMTRVGLADASVGFDPITLDDVSEVIASDPLAQLDDDTPGGAAMNAWAESDYSTDEHSIAMALGEGLKQSSNRAVREAAQASGMMATTMAATCAKTGAGAAVAPLCGAMGAVAGAVAGVLTARHSARHEAAIALRDAWYGANLALAQGIRAIQAASEKADLGLLTDEQAACLLVEALRGIDGDVADRIWGPYRSVRKTRKTPDGVVRKQSGPDAPCGIPGRICTDAFGTMRYAQGHAPFPALPEGEHYPNYFVVEKWWMLRGGYGSCVNYGDLHKDAAWQGKTKTRRARARRMRDTAEAILEATEIVIATIINLRDQRSKVLDRSRAAARKEAEARGAAKGRAKAKAKAQAKTETKSKGGGLVTAVAAGAAGLGLLAALGAFA